MKTVGIFPMVGDLLHTGHLEALAYAKEHVDELVVCLNVDPCDDAKKRKPVESVYERYVRLDSCKYVDKIIPYCGEADLLLLIQTFPHTIRFIGEDHEGKDYTGKQYEQTHNVVEVVIPRRHGLSSTNLKERVVKSMRS